MCRASRTGLILATGLAALIADSARVATAQTERSQNRDERRAYAGAPPAMPHLPLGAVCTSCHGGVPVVVEDLGISPASPHRQGGQMSHCRQCHVPGGPADSVPESGFAGLRPGVEKGHRAHPLAPPMIPHRLFMRENCLACHGGDAARPEIRTTHESQVNCRQCHLPTATRPRAIAQGE